jgi:hypothetical protein
MHLQELAAFGCGALSAQRRRHRVEVRLQDDKAASVDCCVALAQAVALRHVYQVVVAVAASSARPRLLLLLLAEEGWQRHLQCQRLAAEA